jgi:hypothetical protein
MITSRERKRFRIWKSVGSGGGQLQRAVRRIFYWAESEESVILMAGF